MRLSLCVLNKNSSWKYFTQSFPFLTYSYIFICFNFYLNFLFHYRLLHPFFTSMFCSYCNFSFPFIVILPDSIDKNPNQTIYILFLAPILPYPESGLQTVQVLVLCRLGICITISFDTQAEYTSLQVVPQSIPITFAINWEPNKQFH